MTSKPRKIFGASLKPMTRSDPLKSVSFSEIDGWTQDQHEGALTAFRLSAQEIIETAHGFKRSSLYGGGGDEWLDVSRKALVAVNARVFFETEFQPFAVLSDTSLFTGYYEPSVFGSLEPTEEFFVPLYSKPKDLPTIANPKTYFTRKQIEQGALKNHGLEICFLRSWEDAYFIHIQGNGRVALQDGKELRLSFSAKNGQPYISIGRVLLDRGIGSTQTMSMQFLRAWMKANPINMQELLWQNPSFIFFSRSDVIDPKHGAMGAAKVPLTPRRSLAVDRSIWAFGTPLFLRTHFPPEAGGAEFSRLMIAQDTGSAIKGLVRGDVYWGWGPEAELNAGHMKQSGEMIALLPKPLAQRLLP